MHKVTLPGQGGIDRGPGAAPLTWGEETPGLLDEMTAEALPAPRNLEQAMQIIGLAASTPNAQPLTEGVAPAGSGPGALGETTHARRIHPQHRAAVRGFFDRSQDDR